MGLRPQTHHASVGQGRNAPNRGKSMDERLDIAVKPHNEQRATHTATIHRINVLYKVHRQSCFMIATITHFTPGEIMAICQKHEIVRPRESGTQGQNKWKEKPELIIALKELYEERRHPITTIADFFNVSEARISGLVGEFGFARKIVQLRIVPSEPTPKLDFSMFESHSPEEALGPEETLLDKACHYIFGDVAEGHWRVCGGPLANHHYPYCEFHLHRIHPNLGARLRAVEEQRERSERSERKQRVRKHGPSAEEVAAAEDFLKLKGVL